MPSCEPSSPLAFTISAESPDHPDIVDLLRMGTEYANSRHPPHMNFLLDVNALQAEGVQVYVAREINEHTSLGMAALVPIYASPELGKAVEIKRMYVCAHARGRGVGMALIKRIEREASKRGYERVVVETGNDFAGARRLYEKAGFTYIERYGPYKTSEISVCLQVGLWANEEDNSTPA